MLLKYRHWTRHTKVLLIAGSLYVAIGVTFILSQEQLKHVPRLKYSFQVFEPQTWGVIFIGVGLLAMLAGLTKYRREIVGYMLLSGLAFARLAIAAWTFWHTRLSLDLLSTFTWALIAAMWIGISGLISPEDIPLPPPPKDGANGERY